jgi:hypothetical protein
MNKIKWLLATTLLAGGLSLHAETDTSKEHSKISEYGRYIAQADVDGLVDSLVDDATQEGVGVSKSYLERYFKTVELTFTTAGSLKSSVKPSFEILVVAPLSDEEDIFNTYFTQIGASYTDNRTTLNLGLGYRRLSENKYILMGVNAFFDQEIQYAHSRASLGAEYRTTVGEINANYYKATTGWQAGKDDFLERALDGYDIEAGIPLPYMNWATLFAKHSRWDSEIIGSKDLNVNEVQLRAQIPSFSGLEVEAGRKFNSGAASNNENYITVSYNLVEAFVDKPKKNVWINNYAYKLESMEDRRYEKVRRENKIIKQKKKSGSITVIGY